MALEVALPDPDTITTESQISTPELQLVKDLIANVIDLEARVAVLEAP